MLRGQRGCGDVLRGQRGCGDVLRGQRGCAARPSYLLRGQLLSLSDDLLDAADEEAVHVIPPLVGDEVGQGSDEEWEGNYTQRGLRQV